MSANPFQKANFLAILFGARRPEWKVPASTGVPATATAGVPIAGAVKTYVWIQSREELHRRTVRIAIAFDGTTTYEVTIGAFQVDTTGDTDIETTIDAMVSDINSDVDASALVVASREGSGDDSVLLLKGVGPADYAVAVGTTGGTGTITITREDATDVDAWIYLYADGTSQRPEGWVLAKDGHWDNIDYRGWCERLETAGFSRLAVEIVADGAVDVRIGPGVLE
jgi:hypothetical protein